MSSYPLTISTYKYVSQTYIFNKLKMSDLFSGSDISCIFLIQKLVMVKIFLTRYKLATI